MTGCGIPRIARGHDSKEKAGTGSVPAYSVGAFQNLRDRSRFRRRRPKAATPTKPEPRMKSVPGSGTKVLPY